MHRVVVLASLLLAAGSAGAQDAIHEFRPEFALTLPRVYGVGVQILAEQHLETSAFAPNERTEGVGVVSPTLVDGLGLRLALEGRVLLTPTNYEHRYIPTMYTTIPLGDGFELRSRSRVEMRDIDGDWSRRWIQRSAAGRDLDVLGLPVFTYGQLDFSYDTRYSTLNRIDKSVGARIPTAPGASVDLFFTRQDDSRRTPRALYAYGAILRVQL